MKEEMSAEHKATALDVYSLVPLIKEAVLAEATNSNNIKNGNKNRRLEVLQKAFGQEARLEEYISPSVAANCLRWQGYQTLRYKSTPGTFKSEMNKKMGMADHSELLRTLSSFGIKEYVLLDEDLASSGRADLLFKNPRTNEYQILDLKFSEDFGFKQIKKQGPSYIPSPEARLQVLLYMHQKRKEGLNVAIGNVVYINRNNWDTKECFIVWDASAEYEISEFIKKADEARKAVLEEKLPEPSVVSPYVCAGICPFRIHCEYGQKFAAQREKKTAKRKPTWVYRKIKEEAEVRERKAERLGLVQPKLFPT